MITTTSSIRRHRIRPRPRRLRCCDLDWSDLGSGHARHRPLYWLRMFGITAGYHRYFSHRSYKTSRAFQFVLAFLAQSSRAEGRAVVGGEAPPPSPALGHRARRALAATHGLLLPHVGWIFARRHDTTDLVKVADLARYPELVWLHRLDCCRPSCWPSSASCSAAGRAWWSASSGARWLVYHGTFCINSLAMCTAESAT